MTYLELDMDPVSGRFSQLFTFCCAISCLEQSPRRCVIVNFKFCGKPADIILVYFIANRREQYWYLF